MKEQEQYAQMFEKKEEENNFRSNPHPGMHDNMDYYNRVRDSDMHGGMHHMDGIDNMQMGGNRMGNQHMHGGRPGQRNMNSMNDKMSQQPNQMQNVQGGNTYSFFGNTWFSTFYESLMIIFVIGFVFNCVYGKTANDKFALAWYNANKQYFEERYQQIGIQQEQILLNEKTDPKNNSPIV